MLITAFSLADHVDVCPNRHRDQRHLVGQSAYANRPNWMSAAVYGGKIYVFGGLSNTTKLATVERYDPGTNTWDSRAAI
jgi:hypothetical protein